MDVVPTVWTKETSAEIAGSARPQRRPAVRGSSSGRVTVPCVESEQQPVEVRRSRRRRSTVTAYREGDRMVLLIPARFTRAEEREWVQKMSARLAAQERRRRPGDVQLMDRAAELSRRYLGGLARPATVTWVGNQRSRWGSCTPADRTIRLSDRLQGMPLWVVDYVLLHELAHLIEHGHGPRFWSLLEGYPQTERAKGFLEGFAAARDLRIGLDDEDDELSR
jgi:hypothetical protein